MAEVKINYRLSIKSKSGAYSTANEKMTRKQFEKYYDEVVAKGGKVIGIWTDEDSE